MHSELGCVLNEGPAMNGARGNASTARGGRGMEPPGTRDGALGPSIWGLGEGVGDLAQTQGRSSWVHHLGARIWTLRGWAPWKTRSLGGEGFCMGNYSNIFYLDEEEEIRKVWPTEFLLLCFLF